MPKKTGRRRRNFCAFAEKIKSRSASRRKKADQKALFRADKTALTRLFGGIEGIVRGLHAGLEISVAYNLSDIYIELIDSAASIDEVYGYQNDMLRSYCRKMSDLSKNRVVSRHIVVAIDYIRSHIQENLTVESIADSLSLNSSYLSKLFKQEMGITLSRYIRDQKINVACNMLRHLDESSLTIANYLGFSSQSHFIQVFKKSTGLTPEEYRRRNYHQSWMNGESEE